ncbi:hypothetical protein T05_8116 [Trichinella murrelli]|uniref:Uncharacterized protein n=1 Tax=Trichinella murrelli TaxID=144512 RepID=A0A0V0U4H5_9BILA|nr:hypothetical protein T05_8116 [Trichinella murrelli]
MIALNAAIRGETLNTDSTTLSKEEFFQVKRKKRSNSIMLSAVAKNGIIESILLIEAIWPRSVEDNNLRHRYEVLRIGDKANPFSCLNKFTITIKDSTRMQWFPKRGPWRHFWVSMETFSDVHSFILCNITWNC